MKRELKQRIKQDDLVTGYERTAEFVSSHRDQTRVVVLVLAVLVLSVLAFTSWRSHRRGASESAFTEALVLFHAPTAAEIPPGQEASGTVHASETERYTKAKEKFDEVDSRYGSTAAGRRARYYSALCDLKLGQVAPAEQRLQEIAKDGGDDPLVPGLARLVLAESHRAQGRVDQAVEAFRRLADEKTAGVPPDHALMRLAATLEDARRTGEAGAAYKRLAEEFPQSVYAAEARRKAEQFEGPGLT